MIFYALEIFSFMIFMQLNGQIKQVCMCYMRMSKKVKISNIHKSYSSTLFVLVKIVGYDMYFDIAMYYYLTYLNILSLGNYGYITIFNQYNHNDDITIIIVYRF